MIAKYDIRIDYFHLVEVMVDEMNNNLDSLEKFIRPCRKLKASLFINNDGSRYTALLKIHSIESNSSLMSFTGVSDSSQKAFHLLYHRLNHFLLCEAYKKMHDLAVQES